MAEVGLNRNLKAWAIVAIVAGVIALLWGSHSDGFWGSLSGAVGGALVSTGIALVITEIILRPLYANDLLQAARLSAQISAIGLRELSRASTFPWADFVRSGSISIAAESYEQITSHLWMPLLREADARACSIVVYVGSEDGLEHSGIERDWKKRSGSTSRSTIEVNSVELGTVGLVVRTDSSVLLATPLELNERDPMVAHYSRIHSEVSRDVELLFERIEKDTTLKSQYASAQKGRS